MDTVVSSRRRLIALLQLAYSGERAAAFAYRGHWRSVRDPDERSRIRQIEEEEWHHRTLVGEILEKLGAGPSRWLELKDWIIGKAVGLLCHVSGWLAPMYIAGRLESRNIVEYENAARYARDSGENAFVDCLLMMAEVEWEHERYFRLQTEKHFLGRRLLLWPAPPAKENIRLSFFRTGEPA